MPYIAWMLHTAIGERASEKMFAPGVTRVVRGIKLQFIYHICLKNILLRDWIGVQQAERLASP